MKQVSLIVVLLNAEEGRGKREEGRGKNIAFSEF